LIVNAHKIVEILKEGSDKILYPLFDNAAIYNDDFE